jgi:acyl-CoA thioester hydrolase
LIKVQAQANKVVRSNFLPPPIDAFVWPVRVYYEDTDSGGVVYYANYLKFMERARTEWLRALGFETAALVREHRLVFAVTRIAVAYRKPARLGDLLAVGVRPLTLRRASLELIQDVARGSFEDELVCHGQVKIACLDAATLRPRSFPSCIASELTREH